MTSGGYCISLSICFFFPAVLPCVFSRSIGESESICENELSVTLNNDHLDNSITTSSQNKFKLKDEHENFLTGNVISYDTSQKNCKKKFRRSIVLWSCVLVIL